ncbi:MAG TPA: chemotaxis response regulator protein-glutamate methylesterase [Alloacidobacterium sp.]|nr:chemotaxis response regulator protein-glutamate methylesterase [Alloacidobacterium sp.]
MQLPPVRVLVVDDSLVMRSLLRMVLASEPAIELVGMATDGVQALELVERMRPELVLLDIEMPRMNGMEVLSELRAKRSPAKVIMCSTLTRRGARITLEALACGATDYVTKPTAQNGAADAVATLRRELLPKIKALFSQAGTDLPSLNMVAEDGLLRKGAEMVVIGVSTGGPAALEVLLSKLPGDFSVPIVIVQHMPQLFTAMLADRLNRECALAVCEAAPGMRPEAGNVYIARGDWHLEFAQLAFGAGHALRLSQSAPEHFCRPSVDVLFRSAARMFGDAVIGVVLTGMGSDGLEGCKAIRQAGGRVVVQDRESSVVWGMPAVVADAGLAHRVLPLPAIAAELQRLCPKQSSKVIVHAVH